MTDNAPDWLRRRTLLDHALTLFLGDFPSTSAEGWPLLFLYA